MSSKAGLVKNETTEYWPAVVAVSVGIFSLVTPEILPIGLLTAISDTLNIGDGAAGLMVTLPGLVAAISAPLVTVASGRLNRRNVLCGLMALLTIANGISAVAPSYMLLYALS